MLKHGTIIILEFIIIAMFVAIAAMAFSGCGADEVKAQSKASKADKILREYTDGCKLINLRYKEKRKAIYEVYDGPLFKGVGNLSKGERANLMNKRTIELRNLKASRDNDLRSEWLKYRDKKYKEIGLPLK